ncbi:MAG: hypothetical protein AAF551_13670 [Bacteroidota bacterium]
MTVLEFTINSEDENFLYIYDANRDLHVSLPLWNPRGYANSWWYDFESLEWKTWTRLKYQPNIIPNVSLRERNNLTALCPTHYYELHAVGSAAQYQWRMSPSEAWVVRDRGSIINIRVAQFFTTVNIEIRGRNSAGWWSPWKKVTFGRSNVNCCIDPGETRPNCPNG